jgi:ABC-type branched-subunit amino acid transport system substrate-binding protein
VVGFNDSLTGSNATFGQAELALAKGAVGYINDSGGINGRQVQLKVYDSGDIGSGQAPANALQLKQAGAAAIFGPTVSNDCEAVQPIVDAAKIPEVCNFADLKQITDPSSYIFEGDSYETGTVLPMINFLKKETGKSSLRVAVLADYSLGATAFGQKVKDVASKLGIQVVYQGTMSQGSTSVSSYASQIAAAKPDVVLAEIFGPFVAPLDQGLRGAGVDAPIVTTIGVTSATTMLSIKDPKLFSTVAANFLVPGAEGNPADLNTLIAQLGKAGDSTLAELNNGDGASMLSSDLDVLEAMRSCGGCTGSALQQAITSKPFTLPGLISDMQYKPNQHDGHTSFMFWSYDPKAGVHVSGSASYPAGSLLTTTP